VSVAPLSLATHPLHLHRYALQGDPYKVKFYIGPASHDPESGYVGNVYNFSSPLPENPEEPGCDNCKAQRELGILSTGQVPITNVLLDHIQDQQKPLWSLHNNPVQTYLTEHLRWKVTRVRLCPS
jgi:Tyosinase C-terminal domain